MLTFVVLLIAALCGVADEFFGGLLGNGWGSWTFAASQMAVPWLMLGFFAGASQRSGGRAVGIGLAATFCGLLGYYALTFSPFEAAGWPQSHFVQFAESQVAVVVLGGTVSGPLFGYLGMRWHRDGLLWGPLLLAACLCLEPFARIDTGMLWPGRWVWRAEVIAGVAGGLAVITHALTRGRPQHR